MGEKCQCCGYNKCITALEFHHLNSEEKDFSLSHNTNQSWEKYSMELKKCVLVCANCHREIHAGLIDLSLLTSSFNEERANEITHEIEERKSKTDWRCKYCGV